MSKSNKDPEPSNELSNELTPDEITRLMPECFLFEKVLGTIGFGLSSNSDVVIRVKCRNGKILTKILNWNHDRDFLWSRLSSSKGFEERLVSSKSRP